MAHDALAPAQSATRAASTGAIVRAMVCIAAAYLAFVGQGVLTEFLFDPQWAKGLQPTARNDLGLALSLVAALAFGVAAPRLCWSGTPAACSDGDRRVSIFFTGSRSLRGLAGLVVIASIGLCWYANALHITTYTEPTLPSKYPWWISIAFFCGGMVVIRALESGNSPGDRSPRFTKWSYLCFAAITAAALVIRLYDIVDTPLAVSMDNTGAVIAAQESSHPLSWLIPGLGVYGIPAVALVFLKIAVWFHAPDILALRLPEALLGTLMVAGSYLLVWRSFDSHRLAALTAAILAGNSAHIHFSRHIMNLDPWTFVVFGFLLIVHGIRSQRAWALGAAGVVLAFGLQLYLSVRVLVVVMPLFMGYLWRNHRHSITRLYDGWLLFAIGAVVMVGPNIADMIVWPGQWEQSNRTSASFLTIQTAYDASKAHNLPTVASFIEFQLRRILLVPQVLPDTSGQITTTSPMFDLLVAPFLWLGLGSAIASWGRSPAMVLTLLVCGAIMALGQALFNNIPYWPKLIFIMFAGCLWIAIGMLGVYQSCHTLLAWSTQRVAPLRVAIQRAAVPVASFAIILVVLAIGQRQWSGYVVSARRDASQLDLAGRFLYNLPAHAVVCGVQGASDTILGRPEIPFFAQGRTVKEFGKELGPRPAHEVAGQCGPPPFGWVITPDQAELKDALVATYPHGELKTYHHKYGQHLLWTFYVP